MGTFATLDDAREYFKDERFATTNGMQIDELNDDYSICSMEIQPDHKNAIGGVMGGAIFTLADFAFAVSANHDHQPTTAQNVNITFLSVTKGTKLFAKSERIKTGRTTAVWKVSVYDDLGKAIAYFLGTGFKL